MRWLRNVQILSLLNLITIPLVASLQADEQIRIHDRAENPLEPSQAFLKNLSKGRKTLILRSTDTTEPLPKAWIDYLEKNNHQVEIASDLEKLVSNGAYDFDSIIVTNATSLPKRYLNRLIKFYDTRWSIPAAYDEKRIVEMRGLKLPPSLLIVEQTPPASLLYEFGFQKASDEDIKSSTDGLRVSKNPFKVSSAFIDRASEQSSFLTPVVSSPMAQPIIGWNEAQWSGGVIQGDFSWCRAMILPDAFRICGELSDDDDCSRILDWVFHRSKILTWANLNHRRISAGHEFDEYDGTQRKTPYSEAEFKEIEFETLDTYRIQDEMFVSCDIYKLEGNGIDAPFRWSEPDQDDLLNYYGSFEMMVPYWRKPLTVYGGGGVGRKATHLSNSPGQDQKELNTTTSATTRSSSENSFLIEAIEEYGSDDRLNLMKGVSIMAHFKVPHQHGVYKFFIRPISMSLNSPIWLETLLPMRTYLHDAEEPHGIWSAFPFYLSIIIMAIAPMYVLQESSF